MAGITLEIAEERLTEYLAAEKKILGGQAVDMDGRKLTRADLAEVRAGLKFWDGQVKSLTPQTSGGGIQVLEVIPR